MVMRTRRKTITFAHPFLLKSAGQTLPAGDYEVIAIRAAGISPLRLFRPRR
jgi:hypothetical protein